MGSEWPYGSLSELVDFTPKRTIKKGATAPFVAMADIPENSREIAHISQKEFKGSGSRFANGDTLFARITPCLQNGKIAKVSELGEGEIAHGSTEFIVFGAKDPETDQEFLYYLARNPVFRAYAESRMEGSTGRQRVSWQALAEYEFLIPSKNERRSIGRILGSLDDKIELNRQMNATLEAMAQALFKSWFVDFDPVIDNALAAGNPIPEPLQARAEVRKALGTKRKPLPEAIQKQFPGSFVFNEEMGWIPEGWEQKQIKDLACVIKGKSYKSSELSESKTALVTLKSFNRGGGYRLDGLKEYTGSYKPEQEVFAGDLVIAYTDVTQAADVIGKPAMVVSDVRYDHLVISLDVAVVRPEHEIYKYYLYGIAQTKAFQDHTHSYSTGTTVLHLSKDAVPDYYIATPNNNLIAEYAKMAEPAFTSIDKNVSEISSLEKLRDTLLPKLLSGQIRVPDAEKLMEGLK